MAKSIMDLMNPEFVNLEEGRTVNGNIVRRGRRIVFAEAHMTNDEGLVLAKGTQTAVPIDAMPRP